MVSDVRAISHCVTQSGQRIHGYVFSAPKPTVCPSVDEIETLAKVLNKSEKITILAVSRCASALAQLIALAGRLYAPIVHALRSKEFIVYDYPFDVFITGLLGFSSGYFAMMNCDYVIDDLHGFSVSTVFPSTRRNCSYRSFA